MPALFVKYSPVPITKVLGGGWGLGKGEEAFLQKGSLLPPPVLLPFNLQQHIIDQPRLAETEGEGAEGVAFEPIHLGEHGGIDH